MDLTPEQRAQREAKKAARRAAKAALAPKTIQTNTVVDDSVDVACVIHGSGYDWSYVERLHSMVVRNLSRPVRFHVYTEPERPVPAPWIKHELVQWPGISGPKKSWWYKIQLFNSAYHKGPLLYFDLDIVIVNSIDWIPQLSTRYFWAVKDFKYLWRPTTSNVNSSIMWWDTAKFHHVWSKFSDQNIKNILHRYKGDQDYINERITPVQRRLFPEQKIQSWKWQAHNGGMNFKTQTHKIPNQGTVITEDTSVLVFHGKPKPHEISDALVVQNWK